MQRRKPQSKKEIDPVQAEKFLAGAEQSTSTLVEQPNTEERIDYPWNDPMVRKDVLKTFNLRLPEDVFLKLKYVAENTPKTSMHKLCLKAVEETIEQELKKLEK